MRKTGTQLPLRTAAFIPREGVLFEAIDPANLRGEMGMIAQKETQRKSRAETRMVLKQRRGHCLSDSRVNVPVGFGECQEKFCIAQKERPRAENRRGTAGIFPKGYCISLLPAYQ